MSSVCSSVLQDWGDHYRMYVGTTLIDPHVAIQRITSRSWCCPIYKCWRWEFFPLRGVSTYWFVLGRSSSSSALSSVCRVGMSSDYACLFGGRCYRERFLTTCLILLKMQLTLPIHLALLFSNSILRIEVRFERQRLPISQSYHLLRDWVVLYAVIEGLLPRGCITEFEDRHDWVCFLAIIATETCESNFLVQLEIRK